MTLPQSPDGRRGAVPGAAAAARRARAEVKDRLNRGGCSFTQLLQDAATNEVLGNMRVAEVLQALPSVGKSKAHEIMTDVGIAPTRRLRRLCERQLTALLEKFGEE